MHKENNISYKIAEETEWMTQKKYEIVAWCVRVFYATGRIRAE